MEGLLGGIASRLGGLLGDPKVKQALLASFATGGDPSQTGRLILAKNEQDAQAARDKQMEEYRKLQMDQAQLAAEQARQAQARQQYTQWVLGSNLSPEVINSPAFQMAMRQQAAAHGDISALEQGGVLAPLPKPMEMTAEGKNYQLAKSDPGFAEWMKQNQAGANPGGLFAPTIVRNADGTFSAWQPGNKPGMPPVLTPLPGNPINSDVELAALLARERASAGAQGKAEGTAIAGAPEAIGKLDDAITDVTRLVADPAIDSAYGVIQGRTPTVRQGTQDFEAKRDKLIYTLGLAARGQLAGTGQISNFEQEMLLKAQSTLANPLISPQAAKEEMQRMLSWLQSKREKAALIVPNSSPSQSAPQGTTPAPQPGRVVDFNSL